MARKNGAVALRLALQYHPPVLGDSDYIVYADESGDHGLETLDSHYPVFVLVFCIFRKNDYSGVVTPSLQQFKFRHFGHDMTVLHERDIRQAKEAFTFLRNPHRRAEFFSNLNQFMQALPMCLIASVIRKEDLRQRYARPRNPYDIALGFCLERLFSFLRSQGQSATRTHVVFESRGKKEDGQLRARFEAVCAGDNYNGHKLPFEMVFADKKVNSCGLQVADLVARPIGRHILKPDQPNRSMAILWSKFYSSKNGVVSGRGLKCFP